MSLEKQNDMEIPFLDKEVNDAFSRAGLWSRLTFKWLNPLFAIGHKEKLETLHVPSIPHTESANEASSLLEESIHNVEGENINVTLKNTIFHAIKRPLAMNAIFAGVNTIASYVGPLLITSFVNFLFTKDEESTGYSFTGIILALIFFSAKTLESLSQRQWLFGAQRIGVRVRAALTVLIYKSVLAMKYGTISNGTITNLVNVDVERVGDFFLHVHGLWLLPFQVMLALFILYRNLGFLPSVAALLSTVLVTVTNTPLAKLQKGLQGKIMEAKDTRIKATAEMLKSMRVLKLHSWEMTFLEKLMKLRETERSWLKRYLYTNAAITFLFWASPTLVSVVTFGVCVATDTPLTAGTILSALATFRVLGEPIYNLPELICVISQTKVSISRIQEFISPDNHQQNILYRTSDESDTSIHIQTGEYSWEINDAKKPSLMISEQIKIKKGWKVAICGSVGAGKSSLLCGILGEILRRSGEGISTYGTKAFVPQSAWIQTGTIRDNVLFGREMMKGFYEEVVEGCALNRDIQMWSDGDETIVGERGINLSGGQKQRIQMARAIYSGADIYLLDDPFSSVDAHTGSHMFKKCLNHLLRNKTVIYVTHQLEFLDTADLILVMKDGTIVQTGKYDDLIEDSTGELVRQLAAHGKSLAQVNLSPGHHQENHSGTTEPEFENLNRVPQKADVEETESGRVKWHVYSTFIKAAFKGWLVPVVLVCHILFQGLQIASNYWMAWATAEEGRVSKKGIIGIFALLSGGSSFFVLARAVLLSTIALETSQRLYSGMISSVFRAPLSFFDSTHSSRILNRSSSDQSLVDTDIPYRIAGLAFALIQLISIIILMSQVAWQIFALFLVILAISVWYQAYYITTARELARMVGIQKAPILHHFSESITGAPTIRCFNQEDRFFRKNLELTDEYSRVTFHNSATMEWLCVRINFLFNFVFFVLLIILVNLPRSAIDPSLAGLAATYGLNLNVLQAWVIWNFCNVENKMISVERILQFTNIPSEAPLINEIFQPKPDWPFKGTIQIEDLQVRYKPSLPKVLKGITCNIPGEKNIGIVGRTGSGKTTLIQALFRVVEPTGGRIVIDGVDIAMIGLKDLRSRVSIIPQDPVLFQGTLRSNLDPLGQHSDQEMWEVLRKSHLAEIVKRDERLLDAPVSEDGENWSVGQRQLVCLARVLLQRRRILVLDEATASVDTATDNVIQKTIREETNQCSVITVAHRIPTVIDNDLVLVLGEGNILEYDSPARLLEDSSSAFSKLVNEFLKRSSKIDHGLDSS